MRWRKGSMRTLLMNNSLSLWKVSWQMLIARIPPATTIGISGTQILYIRDSFQTFLLRTFSLCCNYLCLLYIQLLNYIIKNSNYKTKQNSSSMRTFFTPNSQVELVGLAGLVESAELLQLCSSFRLDTSTAPLEGLKLKMRWFPT